MKGTNDINYLKVSTFKINFNLKIDFKSKNAGFGVSSSSVHLVIPSEKQDFHLNAIFHKFLGSVIQ